MGFCSYSIHRYMYEMMGLIGSVGGGGGGVSA
jgi:hypothetical protein